MGALRRGWLLITVFVLLALPSVLAWFHQRSLREQSIRADLVTNAHHLAKNLKEQFAFRYAVIDHVRTEFEAKLIATPEQFHLRVKEIRRDFPDFQAINWVNPEGVITWVEPLGPNEKAQGKNLKAHPVAGPIMADAERTKQMQRTPILELYQGGQGFTSYLPIEGGKQGYINAVFRTQPTIEMVVDKELSQQFFVQLTEQNKPVFRSSISAGDGGELSASIEFPIGNRVWRLTILPTDTFLASHSLTGLSGRALLALGLILPFIAALILKRTLKEKDSAQQSQAETEKLVSLVEASNNLVAIANYEGELIYLNKAGFALAKISGDAPRWVHELLDSSVSKVEAAQLLDATIPGKAPFRGRVELSSGCPVYVSTYLVQSGQQQLLGITGRDLRETEALERQFLQAQKMEALGTLAGGVAHDFNNLLTVIAGTAEISLLEEQLSPVLREDLKTLQNAAETGKGLVAQLMAFSRRRAQRSELFSPDKILGGAGTMLKRLIREDISLQLSLNAPEVYLSGDPSELHQVVVNLVVNAKDALPQGGEIYVRTNYLSEAQGSQLVLEVEDSGSGIPEEIKDSIFDPFFTTKGPGAGTGLGLAMVKRVVENWEGQIAIELPERGGTLFRLTIPSHPSPDSADLEDSDSAALSLPKTEIPAKILVVEDDQNIQHTLVRALTLMGHQVSAASSSREALFLLKNPVDVLISDLIMPGGSGAELANNFRKNSPQGAVVFCSGYADYPDISIAAPEPVFLPKPFTVHELHRAVKNALKSSEKVSVDS